MNRPIKFRGKSVDDGDFVYGDFGRAANTGEPVIYFIDDERNWVGATVDEDSIAQLVGYDANGNEVYEGDVVICYDSEEEFDEAPENGVLREVTLYIQVVPDLDSYYCFLKGD